MKKIFLPLLFFAILLSAGCQNNRSTIAIAGQKTGNDNSNKAAAELPANEREKKYYPQDSNQETNQVDSPNELRDFFITPELTIKLYLVDKYNPGNCFSAAGEVTIEAFSFYQWEGLNPSPFRR